MSPAGDQLADRALDVLDDRRLNALGRLVEDQQPRSHRQRAADRELLLLAAREIAAAPARACCFSTGNISKMQFRNPRAALLRRQAHLQVLLDRQPRKDVAPLRHIADAQRSARGRAAARDAPAVEGDLARADRQQAHQAPEQRRLADAVAAEQRRARARGATSNAHVAQDVAAAVVLVEFRESFSIASAPQEHFDHLFVLLNTVHRPFGQHAALVQHRDLLRDPRRRSPCRARPRSACICPPATGTARRCARLVVGHAGDRLVEQQQLRLLHQQHADLQPLLLAVREQSRRASRPRAAA